MKKGINPRLLFRQFLLLCVVMISPDLRAQTPVNPAYTAIDLGTLGGRYSFAYGINDSGQIVGSSVTADNEAMHATLFNVDGTLTDLGTLGGRVSGAYGINDWGQIVGYANTTEDIAQHAVRFNVNGTPTDLGTIGGTISCAYSINNAGQIVGYSYLTGDNASHAVRFNTDGTRTDLGTLGGTGSAAYSINNLGQIVGYSDIAGDDAGRATRFNVDGTLTDLGTLGGASSAAYSINDSGQIVGIASITDNSARDATRFNVNGTRTDLGTLGGRESIAFGINDSGQIVGASDLEDFSRASFLISDGVMTDLNALLQPGSGITNFYISDAGKRINNWGQIVGEGIVGGQPHAVLLNPVDPLTSTSGASRNTKFVGGMAYDKFTATTNSDGLGTTVDILDGIAGSSGSVSYAEGGYALNRDVDVAFTGEDNAGLASDIVSFEGTYSDWIVISLSYDEAFFGDDVALGWFNEETGEWTLAISGNTGAGNTPTFIDGAYNPATDFVLGYYGVDAEANTAWAVIDHNSNFGVVPEPSAYLLIALGLGALLFLRRRTAGSR